MTTSGTSSFNLDLNEYVEEAFERAGGELRTGYHLKTARRSMNLLFADWANRGVNMWTFEQDSIPLVQGIPTYALPSDTVDLLDHVIRTNANSQSNQSDLTITRISVSTYATIPNKLTQGRPIQVWVQRLTGGVSPTNAKTDTFLNGNETKIGITDVDGNPFDPAELPNAGFIQVASSSTIPYNVTISYTGVQPYTDTTPTYLLNCNPPAQVFADTPVFLAQQPSITVWPTPDTNNTYQFVYWRMRRIQDAGIGGAHTIDVPFRFVPCLVAGLAYYIALKIPEGISRLEILKQQYDEAWDFASSEDREKAPDRFVPRTLFYR